MPRLHTSWFTKCEEWIADLENALYLEPPVPVEDPHSSRMVVMAHDPGLQLPDDSRTVPPAFDRQEGLTAPVESIRISHLLAGEDDEELHTERASGITGAEDARVFRRTPGAELSTITGGKRMIRPPVKFCISKAEWEKEEQRIGKVMEAVLRSPAANEDIAAANPLGLDPEEWPTIQEWRPKEKTSQRSLVATTRTVPATGDKLSSSGNDATISGTVQGKVVPSRNVLFMTPAPLEERLQRGASVENEAAAGDQVVMTEEVDFEKIDNILYDKIQDFWDLITQFDTLMNSVDKKELRDTELSRLRRIFRRIQESTNNLWRFADYYYFLLEEDEFTTALEKIMAALPPRQVQLIDLFAAYWDVGKYSVEFWHRLEGCAAAVEPANAVEESRNDCALHCQRHSTSTVDDGDVFQD